MKCDSPHPCQTTVTHTFTEIRTGNVAPTGLAETLVTIVLERILPKVEQVVISSMYNGDKKNDESYSFAECAHGLEWQRLADIMSGRGNRSIKKITGILAAALNVSMPG
jgi:hypothetical protein